MSGFIDLLMADAAEIPAADTGRAHVFIDSIDGQIKLKNVTGAVSAAGGKGDKGDPGIQGAQGQQGVVGVQGIQGIPGVASAPVAMHNALNLQVNQVADFTVAPSVAVPSFVIVLTCIVGETGFAIGDQIFISPVGDNQTTNPAFQVTKSGAVWRLRTGATVPRFYGHGTGVAQALTIGRWTMQTFQV